MLQLWARVDLGAMVMKGYSTFPKAPALLEPHHPIILCQSRTFIGGVLPLCREAVGVFYSPSRLGNASMFVFACLCRHSLSHVFANEILKIKITLLLLSLISLFYRNSKVKIRSPDGDTKYFDIVEGVLQGDTLVPYLFIICLDYVL